MGSKLSRLPSRFPVGTKFVIEGRRAGEGEVQVFKRYIEFPTAPFCGCRRDRTSAGRPRRPVKPAGLGRWPPSPARKRAAASRHAAQTETPASGGLGLTGDRSIAFKA